MTELQIAFKKAAEGDDPGALAAAAYNLYNRVFSSLTAFPVLLLKKPASAFTPEKCLVALHGMEVVGCALLADVSVYRPDFEGLSAKFGLAAEEKMKMVSSQYSIELPLYEVGSVCVDPGYRMRGIARGLYRYVDDITGSNVYAIITADNHASRAAIRSAGYVPIPSSAHSVNFTRDDDGCAVPEPSGDYIVHAELFRPVCVK